MYRSDKRRMIEIVSKDELPQLHFKTVVLELFLPDRKLRLDASFDGARLIYNHKAYTFVVDDIKEYFI